MLISSLSGARIHSWAVQSIHNNIKLRGSLNNIEILGSVDGPTYIALIINTKHDLSRALSSEDFSKSRLRYQFICLAPLTVGMSQRVPDDWLSQRQTPNHCHSAQFGVERCATDHYTIASLLDVMVSIFSKSSSNDKTEALCSNTSLWILILWALFFEIYWTKVYKNVWPFFQYPNFSRSLHWDCPRTALWEKSRESWPETAPLRIHADPPPPQTEIKSELRCWTVEFLRES